MNFSFLRKSLLCVFLTACLSGSAPLAVAGLIDDLAMYWPLDVIENGQTPDLAGTNHLTLNNITSTNFVPGKFGNAFSFNGYSQFLSLNYNTHPKLPIYSKGEFTIALWVRGAEKQDNRILFAEGSREDKLPLFLFGTHREAKNGQLNVMVRDQGMILNNIPTDGTAFNNEWRHIAWVNSGNTGKVYINGEMNTEYRYERPQLKLNYLSIGALLREPPLYFFKGEVDEVAIWERSLTKKEILEAMNKGIPPPNPPPAGD